MSSIGTERIKTIHRIHPAQERRSTLRPAGLYLFQSEVLQGIPPARYFDLKEQLFAPLYQQGRAQWIWEIPGYSQQHHQYRRFLHRQPGYSERPGTDAGSGKTPKSFG